MKEDKRERKGKEIKDCKSLAASALPTEQERNSNEKRHVERIGLSNYFVAQALGITQCSNAARPFKLTLYIFSHFLNKRRRLFEKTKHNKKVCVCLCINNILRIHERVLAALAAVSPTSRNKIASLSEWAVAKGGNNKIRLRNRTPTVKDPTWKERKKKKKTKDCCMAEHKILRRRRRLIRSSTACSSLSCFARGLGKVWALPHRVSSEPECTAL